MYIHFDPEFSPSGMYPTNTLREMGKESVRLPMTALF